MNRRGFLAIVGAGVAGLVLDPERLTWVPGAKTYVLPPPDGWRQDGRFVLPDRRVAVVASDGWSIEDHGLRTGDIITIGGRFVIDPRTRKPMKELQQFVVVATTEHDATLKPQIQERIRYRIPFAPPLTHKDRGWNRRRRA